MHFKVITPSGIIFDKTEVDSITIPTKIGIITVKEDHIPLLSIVSTGIIELTIKKELHYLAISHGILEVKDNIIEIIADTAEKAEDIDIERAETAKKQAEELIRQKDRIDDASFALLQAKIEKELVRINVGRKYKKL